MILYQLFGHQDGREEENVNTEDAKASSRSIFHIQTEQINVTTQHSSGLDVAVSTCTSASSIAHTGLYKVRINPSAICPDMRNNYSIMTEPKFHQRYIC